MTQTQNNAIYAQSGGVTAVINASAAGVIETARQHRPQIHNVLAAKNGVVGILREEFYDTSKESARSIAQLRNLPGGAFGSCRFKLKQANVEDPIIRRLFEVFKTHSIRYFFYNGGGDSQDTINKIAQLSTQFNYPLKCIGIPKTVDNDLAMTDNCPGFGSVAKYIAVSTREAALDVRSMCDTSTKVFILEVMGRHAGWIAAASGLAGEGRNDPPQVILFPEIPFDQERFLTVVRDAVDRCGYCVVVASEGIRDEQGHFITGSGRSDSFGHTQLGGVGASLAHLVDHRLGLKYHYAIADYLQRAARHLASQTDLDQSYRVGQAAVEYAVKGESNITVVIKRIQDEPYRWEIGSTPVDTVANTEKKLPRSYITDDGFGITVRARSYLLPLIQGEAYPDYVTGLPDYVKLKNELVPPKLPTFNV